MRHSVCTLLVLAAGAPLLSEPIELRSWAINLDGSVYRMGIDPLPAVLPCELDFTPFDTATGLGRIGAIFREPGAHYISFYFDHEILGSLGPDQDWAFADGHPLRPGITWEADDWRTGDIWSNFSSGSLDNSAMGFPPGGSTAGTGDIALSMGVQFSQGQNRETAIYFWFFPSVPLSRFWIGQFDPPEDGQDLEPFLYSLSATKVTYPATVPEPATWQVVGLSVLAVSLYRLKRRLR